MPHFASTTFLPLFALAAALSLSACRDKPEVSEAPALPDKPATASLPALPQADFWTPLSAIVAGSHGGECVSVEDMKPGTGPISIGADGKVTSADYAGTLLTTDFTLLRIAHGASPQQYSVTANRDDFTLALSGNGKPEASAVTIKHSKGSLTCSKSNSLQTVAGKSLYSVYAHLLDSAAHRITCQNPNKAAVLELNYRVEKGILAIDDQTFELAKMDHEMIMFGKTMDAFTYTASMGNERGVMVMLDRSGKWLGLQVRSKDGLTLACAKQ